MISLATLKYLTSQKIADALVLFRNRRNAAAIYLMGYAIEFALKRKICLTLNFYNGFPESNVELKFYTAQLSPFNLHLAGGQLTQIKQIKNHNLPQLLTFSGAETFIISSYFDSWNKVQHWTPEQRYRRRRFTVTKTAEFMQAATKILQHIS